MDQAFTRGFKVCSPEAAFACDLSWVYQVRDGSELSCLFCLIQGVIGIVHHDGGKSPAATLGGGRQRERTGCV